MEIKNNRSLIKKKEITDSGCMSYFVELLKWLKQCTFNTQIIGSSPILTFFTDNTFSSVLI